MAMVYVTFKIMPKSPETNIPEIGAKAKELIVNYGGNFASQEEVPIAFGLKALNIIFSMNEDKGATDPLEEQIEAIDGVQSVQVTDVRRGIG